MNHFYLEESAKGKINVLLNEGLIAQEVHRNKVQKQRYRILVNLQYFLHTLFARKKHLTDPNSDHVSLIVNQKETLT